ncbi:MAG: phosphogluconate dehydratase [Hellea sp.]|nr:phosphogluconate dehydratase [Hellea sp.]
MTINSKLARVTQRIQDRSERSRKAYLNAIQKNTRPGPRRSRLSEGNVAHASAACPILEKTELLGAKWANIGIITAYNDMLSAHQPFAGFPDLIKHAARRNGATAQVAGGVPAMCDGVTQGQDGMELSLFSRDIIAYSTAIALSHDMFDAAIHLGVCDKIVPGLLIGALRYGHIPQIFAPAGPMPSGITNPEKIKIRQLFAEGKVGREELLAVESASYHAPGTCTFYGTANTNQMLMEIMGLQLPGASFVHPNTPLRDAITAQTTRRAVQMTDISGKSTPIGHIIDEKAIVNGLVGLMATGGSTNLTIHMIAIAAAAGIIINWDDFSDIAEAVPLICRIYPNGVSDINHFHAAGGMSYLIRELIETKLLHTDVKTVAGDGGLVKYTFEPVKNTHAEPDTVLYREGPKKSLDSEVLTNVDKPFQTNGGLKLLTGNIGRSVIKVSAVKKENWVIEAPAIVIDNQNSLVEMYKAGELDKDFIVVLRFQGPRANGMPELHKLTPILGSLQDRGFKIAMVTDGRMSGASGKVPTAIHMHPEAISEGNISKINNGDIIRLDAVSGTVNVISEHKWLSRGCAKAPQAKNLNSLGMNMFAPLRSVAGNSEDGASVLGKPSWMP